MKYDNKKKGFLNRHLLSHLRLVMWERGNPSCYAGSPMLSVFYHKISPNDIFSTAREIFCFQTFGGTNTLHFQSPSVEIAFRASHGSTRRRLRNWRVSASNRNKYTQGAWFRTGTVIPVESSVKSNTLLAGNWIRDDGIKQRQLRDFRIHYTACLLISKRTFPRFPVFRKRSWKFIFPREYRNNRGTTWFKHYRRFLFSACTNPRKRLIYEMRRVACSGCVCSLLLVELSIATERDRQR